MYGTHGAQCFLLSAVLDVALQYPTFTTATVLGHEDFKLFKLWDMCISIYFGSKKRTLPSVPVRMLNCTVKNTSGNKEHLGLLTTCFSEHIPSVIQRTFREFEQPTTHLKYTEKVFPA